MLVTERTKAVKLYRRSVKDWIAEGFVSISENGDPLWKLHRGAWTDKKITEVRIAPGGKEIWIKIQ